MIKEVTIDSIYLEKLENNFTEVFTIEKFKKNIKDNIFTKYFTYLIDNQPVGLINYDIMYERAELVNINVLTEFQNQKIATKLLEFMMKDCQNKKVSNITLEVKQTNTKAINLYKKFGFQQVGIREKYYQGIDAILMEKEWM